MQNVTSSSSEYVFWLFSSPFFQALCLQFPLLEMCLAANLNSRVRFACASVMLKFFFQGDKSLKLNFFYLIVLNDTNDIQVVKKMFVSFAPSCIPKRFRILLCKFFCYFFNELPGRMCAHLSYNINYFSNSFSSVYIGCLFFYYFSGHLQTVPVISTEGF